MLEVAEYLPNLICRIYSFALKIPLFSSFFFFLLCRQLELLFHICLTFQKKKFLRHQGFFEKNSEDALSIHTRLVHFVLQNQDEVELIFFFTKVVFKVLILFLLLFSVLPSLSIPQRDWIFRYLETANKCIFKRQIDFFGSNIQCSFEVIIQLHIQQLVHSLFIAQFFHLLPILYPPSIHPKISFYQLN